MTLLDIFDKVYNEEVLPRDARTRKRKTGILLLDVDDTLLQASDIFIWRKLPTDKKEVRLTPEQYAKEHVTPELKKYYSYREFDDPHKVGNSIRKGIPYINNLKAMDKFISGGYEIGILTARGMETVVYKALRDFLRYRTPDGKLVPVKIKRKYVFAVNDSEKTYEGSTDYEKKKNVINKIKNHFDYVYFMDDDLKNIKSIADLKKELPREKAKGIRTITATKPKTLEERYLVEMAVEDMSDEKFVKLINSGDLKNAGYYYINKVVKNNPRTYKQDEPWIDHAHRIGGRGISRTLSASLKRGVITQDFADKVREAVNLAVSDPPKRDIKKQAEIKLTDKKEEVERKKAKEKAKAAPKTFPGFEEGISEMTKEIARVRKLRADFVTRFLTTPPDDDGIDLSTASVALNKNFKLGLNWIKTSFLPDFVTTSLTAKEKKYVNSKAGGDDLRTEALETEVFMNRYIKFIEDTISQYEYIIKYSSSENNEEKMEELESPPFRSYFDRIMKFLNGRSPEDTNRKLSYKKLDVSQSDRDSGKETLKGVVKKHYDILIEIEKAFAKGELQSFVSSNWDKIKERFDDILEPKKRGELPNYEKPQDIDDKEISIDEDEDFDEDEENEIFKKLKFGPRISKLIKERKGKDYKYSGIERDTPEFNFLKKYSEGEISDDNRAFRVLVNIFLDSLDGLDTVMRSKNKGTGTKESRERLSKIILKKQTAEREKELEKQGDSAVHTPEDVISMVGFAVDRISDSALKTRMNSLLKLINFDNLDKNTLRNIAKAHRNLPNLISELTSDEVVDTLSDETVKNIVIKEVDNFSEEDRFAHRIAININLRGNRYSKEQIRELFRAVFQDETGVALKRKLSEEGFSKRIER